MMKWEVLNIMNIIHKIIGGKVPIVNLINQMKTCNALKLLLKYKYGFLQFMIVLRVA